MEEEETRRCGSVPRMHLLLLLLLVSAQPGNPELISSHSVQQWAKMLGMELWTYGKYVTRRDELLHRYKEHATVMERSGSGIVQDMARDVKDMMDLKISAVKRIMDAAENTAMSHHDELVLEHDYLNAKLMVPEGEQVPKGGREMVLTPNSHFYNIPVNTSVSSVHVPTNVFDGAPDVMRAIKWSENLDSIFTNNYRMDPSLSWQYFGSSFGFMRQYPALQWKQEPVDLYDCRTRGWYIEAATSAKDVIILVDFSGSMTGMRKEIARHAVTNILDTLSNNDFVNIFTFSEETQELIPCFRDTLVQATLANVRELKGALEELETKDIANFTTALSRAFELLQWAREERYGANCNQAIMLVTDEVPAMYEELFQEYNWKDLPKMPVRMFTYLIGREVPDVERIKWVACANQGYYVHLSTLAEVREQVLQYISVMARPMVLHRTEHPVVWTPVYADVTDPKMTDWLWEMKECAEQKERFESYRRDKEKFDSKEEQDRRFAKKLRRTQDQTSGDLIKYQLMTSVSMPVFDRRENANITERILINEAYWVKRTRETRVANLLGVAGTDVPIQDILKLLSPHVLGVNGYAFIITNNGFILTHPDLRPVFQDILKPSYNSVDMSEVELMDTENEARDLTDAMKAFRDAVINQSTGTVTLDTRYHFDGMRRSARMRRHYYYTAIPSTPFTLVVSLPDKYGASRVHGVEEIRRSLAEGQNIMSYFKGKNWRVHPDWIFCKYHYDTEHPFDSAEHELLHFLERAQRPGWHWPLRRLFTPPERQQGETAGRGGSGRARTRPPPPSNISPGGKNGKVDKDSYYCDRTLFLSLLFDAKMTEGFSQNFTTNTQDDSEKGLKEHFGITVSFIATHTGLTRWHDFPLGLDPEDATVEGQFSSHHNRATDELWYRRAVEQHMTQPDSFVYSVPHEIGHHNDTLITASHALFLYKNERKAPVAVVGFQFLQSALFNRFMNITSYKCTGPNCKRSCSSLNVACYLLDNHGYIIISKNLQETGHFFGEIQGYVMQTMIDEGIFQRIRIYDYQAVCFKGDGVTSDATPARVKQHILGWFFDWLVSRFFWFYVQSSLQDIWHMSWAFVTEEAYDAYEEDTTESGKPGDRHKRNEGKVLINRTRPQACDQYVDLYQLSARLRTASDKPSRVTSDKKGKSPTNNNRYDAKCNRPFLIEPVDASNMLLVVVDLECEIPFAEMSVIPSEVSYNESLPCHRIRGNILPRKTLGTCINHHPREKEIELCGRANRPLHAWSGLILALLVWLSATG
ncbi:voltage-dependent calcium channel subunit alpha-2/delta-3 isoform X4 [Neocloeon triangulifer]|uniref:voltage-dependent calcium channel subunit alpha-2/delta-3 isoform X4 n=1 Tax=Neocloeon triangulifer TaxID=2078957 RepID=UPI00286EFA21|nr:voltage-dependent calcium channel subunit alpha-2/delta-3 isoform X4 [Neocloeon triangulifer]